MIKHMQKITMRVSEREKGSGTARARIPGSMPTALDGKKGKPHAKEPDKTVIIDRFGDRYFN